MLSHVGLECNTHRPTFCTVFAPIALIMPYDTIEDAIEIANDTRYALGASVFGPDKYECLAVAKQLDCGMVAVNDFGVFYVGTIHVQSRAIS